MTEDQVWLTMNDGVRLDASVCRPDGAGPWPAVVLVHGHGEDGSKASTLERGRRYAGLGYLALCYSVRGQGGSEGLSYHLGARELFDLQDVVAWTRGALPVRPERVAVCGSSQGGWHAWMAAAHTDVAAVIPENIFVDYAEFAVPEGALSTWFFTKTMRRRVMSAGLQDQARRWAVDRDWGRLRAALAPMSPAWFADRMACPVLAVHGWHDVGMPGHDLLALFARLRGPRRLYLGGGGHDGQDATSAADVRRDLVERWLARWLLGADDARLDGPPILCARRPGWEHSSVDAVEGSEESTWFLRHGGALDPTPPPSPTPNSNVQHRPLDPAYTLQVALDRDLVGSLAAWPREEAVFDGPPLADDLDLLGVPRFELHVLPERPWYQIHAELWDLPPAGDPVLVSHGHRGTDRADPGLHARVEVRGRPIAYRVAAGHRLRVVIADQRPSHLVPEYRPWRARLYHEPGRASAVTLPIR